MSIHNRWRPQNLLFVAQTRALLLDLVSRYKYLAAARSELETLPRADRYIKSLTRMRFALRQAHYVWKADQLTFIRAVSEFYSDFGAILKLLKEDADSGKLVS